MLDMQIFIGYRDAYLLLACLLIHICHLIMPIGVRITPIEPIGVILSTFGMEVEVDF